MSGEPETEKRSCCAARRSTTSRRSRSVFPWGHSSPSPVFQAQGSRPFSRTSCIRFSRTGSAQHGLRRVVSRPSKGWRLSTRSSTSTRDRSAARLDPIPQRTSVSFLRSGPFLPSCRSRRPRATGQAGSRSTSRAGAARSAREPEQSGSRCTSFRMSMSPATCARGGATTGRPSRCGTRGRTSTKSSR